MSLWKAVTTQAKAPVLKSLAYMVGGTFAGQLVVLLASPILTRIYSDESFGLLGQYTAIVSILLAIASFRYEFAIPKVDTDEEALDLLALSIVLVLTLGSILVLLCLLAPLVAPVLGIQAAFLPYLWAVPLGLLGVGMFQAFNYMAIRKRVFKAVSGVRLVQGVTTAGIQLALGFLKVGPWGLLVGQALGPAAGSGSVWRAMKLRTELTAERFRISTLKTTARAHLKFAAGFSAFSLVNAFALNLQLLLMAFFFGIAANGQLTVALRVAAIVEMLGLPISQVFYGEVSNRARENPESVLKFFKKSSLMLLAIGVPVGIILFFFGDALVRLVFGAQWVQAGSFVPLLVPYIIVNLLVSGTSSTLTLLGKYGVIIFFDVLRIWGMVFAFWIASGNDDPAQAVLLFSLITSGTLLGIYAANYYLVRREFGAKASPAL
ncbi:MAG: lipopolysaccharide biosynthesis protein [Fimbriimonadaceae bacterium]